jgi:putative endonuclease
MEAYFYLRSLGYRIVAKNFRTPHEHGEIDMIGWDDGVLCFIEVKTLTKVTLAPPEMAVDADKKRHIRSVARRYVRRLRSDRPPTCRFDVVSVTLGDDQRGPTIRVHKGAFAWKTTHITEREPHTGVSRGRWWRK